MKNKIICAIPVYNEENILQNYLENLLNQELKENWELYVVVGNNNSTDKTVDILNDFKSKYNNLDFINVFEKGVSITRRNLQEYIIDKFKEIKNSCFCYYLSLDCESVPYKQGFIDYLIKNIEESQFELKIICVDSDAWDYEKDIEKEIIDFRNQVSTFDDLNGITMNACCYLISLNLLYEETLIPKRILLDKNENIYYDTIDDIIYLLYFFNPYHSVKIESPFEIDYIDATPYISTRVTNKINSKQYYNGDRDFCSILDIKKNIAYTEIIYYIILNLFIYPEESIYNKFGKNKNLNNLVNYIKNNYLYKQKCISYELFCMIAVSIWHLHREYFLNTLEQYNIFKSIIPKIRILNDKLINSYIKIGKNNNLKDEEIFDMLYDYYFINYNSLDKFLVDYV